MPTETFTPVVEVTDEKTDFARVDLPDLDTLTEREVEICLDNIACRNEERARLQGPNHCNPALLEAPGQACQKP